MFKLDGCGVRAMTSDDLDAIRSWRNRPEVRRFSLTQHEISAAEHAAWFERASSDPRRRLFIVEENGVALGFVNFADVEPEGTANWGFYAAPGARKGAGRALGQSAIREAFTTLGLHKVCGQALAGNEASIRMHLALGFQEEGRLREQCRIDGQYQDLVCFGLLRSEWMHQDEAER